MSSDLLQALLRVNSKYNVKRSGITFTTEPTSLTNIASSKKGLASGRGISFSAGPKPKSVRVSFLTGLDNVHQPKKFIKTVVVTGSTTKQLLPKIANIARVNAKVNISQKALEQRLNALL